MVRPSRKAAVNEVEDCASRLGLRPEAVPREKLAFEGGEEALAHGVVPRARLRRPKDKLRRRRPNPSRDARLPYGSVGRTRSRYIANPVGVMDHPSRSPRRERHVQSIQAPVAWRVSADNATAIRIEHDGEIEKPRPGRNAGESLPSGLTRGT